MPKPAWVYCHGLPGLPEELRLSGFLPAATNAVMLDRLGAPGGGHEESLLAAFDSLGLKEPVMVAGFSLGAMSALRLAARRPLLVHSLVLASPAAPLELGDFLPAMAGRPVFEAARRGPISLGVLGVFQSGLLSVAPKALVSTMFRKSCAAEQRLLSSKPFADTVTRGLRTCLGPHRAAYQRELSEYVSPWADLLDDIRCDVEIVQGAEDDWTPPAMAEALRQRLGARALLTVIPGLGHYSALQAAAAQLTGPHIAPDAAGVTPAG